MEIEVTYKVKVSDRIIGLEVERFIRRFRRW